MNRTVPIAEFVAAHPEYAQGAPTTGSVDQDMRLKRCGLVFYENQLSSQRFVAPAGRPQSEDARLKVLPLYLTKPVPGMEIEALDGEKYVLEKDFNGDWFDVTSPKGVKLIG